MNISLKLYKPFISQVNKLREKYGENFEKLNGFHNINLNFTDFIDNFIDEETVADTTIDPNANSSTHDITTLLLDMVKPHQKLLAYNKIFYEIAKQYDLNTANEWLETEWNGGFYLHDASTSSYKPYCYAYDLQTLVEKGLWFIDKFKAKPAKHLDSFNSHVTEFISWNSNRTSGAVGLPSYLVHSFYFWKHDIETGYYMKSPEYYRDQMFQKFIYELNQPYLRVTECAFTNISILDRNYLIELFGDREYPDGTYVIDYIDEIIEYQKSFMEVVSKIRKEMMMTFPVLTYSLLYQNGKFVDEDFAKWCNKHNMEWCDSNFFVSEDVGVLSNCCRLLSDTKKLNAFINSIGGTSLSIGSVKVGTINLRRIAIEANGNKEKYLNILRDRVILDMKVLKIIRSIIERNVEKGLLTNYQKGLIEMDKQYCTIGITAMYETIDEFGLIETDRFGNKYYTKKGLDFACKIMNEINQLKDNFDCEYSMNIEAIPAENANVKLSYKDQLLYPNSKCYPVYSNQWIPLVEKCTIQEKVRLGSILDKQCGGGQISHINLQGKFTSEEQAWDLLNYIASQGVIYFAYNMKIGVCEDGHGSIGSNNCPECGKPIVDTFQRIVGFLTPSKSYSKERKIEFSKRQWYNLSDN